MNVRTSLGNESHIVEIPGEDLTDEEISQVLMDMNEPWLTQEWYDYGLFEVLEEE